MLIRHWCTECSWNFRVASISELPRCQSAASQLSSTPRGFRGARNYYLPSESLNFEPIIRLRADRVYRASFEIRERGVAALQSVGAENRPVGRQMSASDRLIVGFGWKNLSLVELF